AGYAVEHLPGAVSHPGQRLVRLHRRHRPSPGRYCAGTRAGSTVAVTSPHQVSSMNAPRWARPGPDTVPEANRSPVRVAAPPAVRWASICAGDQYMDEYGGRETTVPFQATASSMSS